MKVCGILQIFMAVGILGVLYFLIPFSLGFGGFFGWLIVLAAIPPSFALAFFLFIRGVSACRTKTEQI
ncbi:MAG: hypothetical protein AAGJ81_04590 [Verrucomicrobiota bacterium]